MRPTTPLALSLTLALIAGCETTKPTATRFVMPPADAVEAAPNGAGGPLALSPGDPQNEARPLVPGKPSKTRGRRTVEADTVNAVTVYPYEDDVIYQVATTPNFFTTIYLQPGEQVIGKMLGNPNPVHWLVNETYAGSAGGVPVPILTVKPGTSGLKTNLLITTSIRTYQIDLASYSRRAMDSVRWTYPKNGFVASSDVAQGAPLLQAAFNPASLHRNYTIDVTRGDPPIWTPVAAFDVGNKTYVEFPENIGEIPAPPLFVIEEGGLSSPVTFRPRGRYYEIDRVFNVAELRLGAGDNETVVRIQRNL